MNPFDIFIGHALYLMFLDEKKAQFLPLKELLRTSTFPNQGFTMLEVLAALMISFAFLMGALNGITMAVWMQVKAERQAQAGYWIQQDLERVRSEAANLTTSSISSACTGNFSTSTSYGYLLLDALAMNTNLTTTSPAITSITTSPVGKQQTQIVKTGEASTTFVTNSTKKFSGKEYRLVRVAEGYDSNPQLLRLTYKVGIPTDSTSDTDRVQNDTPTNTSIIATLYTEIIPSAAMACP
jgi:prepilin-type N-terminal cleavage/methylation domain-containing protein